MSELIQSKRTLTTLYLNDNRIGNDGVKHLANALCQEGTNLQQLYLKNNERITDDSVNILSNMFTKNQSLTAFSLQGCGINDNGKERLKNETSSKNFFF